MPECEHCGNTDPQNAECEVCGGCEICCPYPDDINPPDHEVVIPLQAQPYYVDHATMTGMYDHY